MLAKRKRRIYFILFLLSGVGIAVGLALFALRQNINLYYTPEEVLTHKLTSQQTFRLGGLVENGSVRHDPDHVKVSFILTDFHKKIKVEYSGILPSLFKEGQGIVAEGKLNANNIFIAEQVLAKHDSTYKPPLKYKPPKVP